jgi:alkylhydroperoxidase/carboxymuconolactone decarboxylase family protein YurZ
MTTNTHNRHVSEQHLLGPDVEQARDDRGAQVLAAVDGEGGQSVVDALADIAPALAHHVVAYAFGDVYARPGLTHPQRQLVTLGMLTALAQLFDSELDQVSDALDALTEGVAESVYAQNTPMGPGPDSDRTP